MADADLARLTISAAADLIHRGEISPVALAEAVLAQIDRLEDRVNAYITVTAEEAVASARTAEAEIARGKYRGPLHGIPVAVKDLCQTAGIRTTAGSQILRDWVPEEDAELVSRLKAAGACIVGKTNLHEFAYGVTTANPHYGPTRNPWDLDRVPGGSSGGSAAAVSADMCLGAIGSDTGGSIRLPAAFCGIVGLKPTYGRVSRRGCIPLSWTLDHMGPMTNSARDSALLLNVIAGHDPRDQGSSTAVVPDFTASLGRDLKGLRVARLRGYVEDLVDPEIASSLNQATSVLRDLGATVEDVTIAAMDHAPTLSVTIMATEATTYHLQDLRARQEEYGADVRMRLKLGANILGIDYVQAQRMRGILIDQVDEALSRFDAIITPSSPQPPMRIDEIPEVVGPGPATRYLLPFNVTGHPALSVPCGFTGAGLPAGMQLIGRHFDELTLLQIGDAYERAAAWRRSPPLLATS